MVQRGDLLVELEEVQDKYLDKNQLNKLKGQNSALHNKRSATQRLISSLEQQIKSLTAMQMLKLKQLNKTLELLS